MIDDDFASQRLPEPVEALFDEAGRRPVDTARVMQEGMTRGRRRRRRRRAVTGAGGALAVVGCVLAVQMTAGPHISGSPSPAAGPAPFVSPSASAPVSRLSAVKVSGAVGAKPVISFRAPFVAAKLERKVLKRGHGATVGAGWRVSIDYVCVDGADGKEIDTTFGQRTATFTLGTEYVIKGVVTGLTGTTVGSRVLIAVPPADSYGSAGVPAAGIRPTDTLLFVVDVRSTARQ